jgi:phosphate:Na+ symporter
MSGGWLEVIGGIGLFLLGMAVMTEGLQRLAGEWLRGALKSFTKTPFSGVLTGMVVTALVQSSGATTVMAVGFVGARLLTFPEALGIIFGANVGTTATGWIVALWGFTFSLRTLALPLLFVGAMLRLLRVHPWTAVGFAMAGFGAVFVGVAMLQFGMETYKEALTPEHFPPDTAWGRSLLLLMGLGITLITQSSTAGVAAAITAVHVGNMSLSQAAAMVIGMDIGTSVTAVLAALGGNVGALRTGLSHLVFNGITGLVAFVGLPLYLQGLSAVLPSLTNSHPELALVLFHSLFNLLGVIAILPVSKPFARWIERLVPSKSSLLSERLEPSLIKQPQAAIESVLITLQEISQLVFASISRLLSANEVPDSNRAAWSSIHEAHEGLEQVREYLNRINDPVAVEAGFRQKVRALHVLDHLSRLVVRVSKGGRLEAVTNDSQLSSISQRVAQVLDHSAGSGTLGDAFRCLRELSAEIDQQGERLRHQAIQTTATGQASLAGLTHQLEAIRWLQRVAHHAMRITYYFATTTPQDFPPELEENNHER